MTGGAVYLCFRGTRRANLDCVKSYLIGNLLIKKVIAIAAAGLFALSTAAYAGAGAKSSAEYEGGCGWGAKQTASTPVPVETAQTPAPKPETKPGG